MVSVAIMAPHGDGESKDSWQQRERTDTLAPIWQKGVLPHEIDYLVRRNSRSLGIIGLAVPVFTTSQTKDVAKLGDVKIQSTEQSTHVVPQVLSAGALVLGVILIGAGAYAKR